MRMCLEPRRRTSLRITSKAQMQLDVCKDEDEGARPLLCRVLEVFRRRERCGRRQRLPRRHPFHRGWHREQRWRHHHRLYAIHMEDAMKHGCGQLHSLLGRRMCSIEWRRQQRRQFREMGRGRRSIRGDGEWCIHKATLTRWRIEGTSISLVMSGGIRIRRRRLPVMFVYRLLLDTHTGTETVDKYRRRCRRRER